MPNPPIPPGAGYSPTIHPQDFYEQPQGGSQLPPRPRGISTQEMIQNQFSSWGNLLRKNDDQFEDQLAHLFSHKNALEQTGAARPDYMHEHLNDLHGQIMGKVRAFSSSVAPDMYRLDRRPQQSPPPAHTHRPWQPQGSFHQAGSRPYETGGTSRPAPPVSRDNVDHRQDGTFDYDALSPEDQLQANAYIHGASQKTMSNTKKSVHYPVSSQGWRRNHHVSEVENPEDDTRLDEQGLFDDSDNQSFKDHPIPSPTGRDREPDFDDLYDVSGDEGAARREQGPDVPPPIASRTQPSNAGFPPQATSSSVAAHGRTGMPPVSQQSPQLSPGETAKPAGTTPRKAVPPEIPPHIDEWVLQADQEKIERLQQILTARLSKLI